MDFMNNGQNPGIVTECPKMSRKIGRVLSIDIIQHAGARESGRFRHSGRRYTLFWAFLGVPKLLRRSRSERAVLRVPKYSRL